MARGRRRDGFSRRDEANEGHEAIFVLRTHCRLFMETAAAVISALERAPEIVVPLVREVPAVLLKRRPTAGKWSAHEHACHLAFVHRLFFDRLDQILASPTPVITPYEPGQSDPDDLLLKMDLGESLEKYVYERRRLVER